MPTLPETVARYVDPVVVSWVVEALPLNCCNPDQELDVVVPKAMDKVLSDDKSPPPNIG
jgi:hypothetical protein